MEELNNIETINEIVEDNDNSNNDFDGMLLLAGGLAALGIGAGGFFVWKKRTDLKKMLADKRMKRLKKQVERLDEKKAQLNKKISEVAETK